MKKLDFVGIGAPKCGTTWLTHQLTLHPQIFIPPAKEMQYFSQFDLVYGHTKNKRHPNPTQSIHKDFQSANSNQLWGEYTTQYLYEPRALKRIKSYNPHIKILVMLRNPIDQIVSSYNYTFHAGRITQPISTAVFDNPMFLKHALYSQPLSQVFQHFNPNQIFIGLFKDIKTSPQTLLQHLAKFLNIKPFPQIDRSTSNPTLSSRNQHLNQIIAQAHKTILNTPTLHSFISHFHLDTKLAHITKLLMYSNKPPTKPTLDLHSLQKLKPILNQDIDQLEKLLNQDLSHWKI